MLVLLTYCTLTSGGIDGVGLDDYVMLKCLSEEAYQREVCTLVDSVTKSITMPVLSEVLLKAQTTMKPLLLFYDEQCPYSQPGLFLLEEEVRSTFKVHKGVCEDIYEG